MIDKLTEVKYPWIDTQSITSKEYIIVKNVKDDIKREEIMYIKVNYLVLNKLWTLF